MDKRTLVGFLVGLVLTVWFFSTVDWGELWLALQRVSGRGLALACAIMMLEWVLRGARWWVLVRHVDRTVGLWALISTTMIGAALNTIVPLRGGDLVRPGVLAQSRNLPYTTMFSTTIVERVLDMAGILVVIGAMVFTLPEEALTDQALVDDLKWSGKTTAILGTVVIGLALMLGTKRARGTVERVLAPLPESVRGRMLSYFDQLIAGMAVAGHPGRLLTALVLTPLIWLAEAMAVHLTLEALAMPQPFASALFVVGAIALGTALPQAPGYWGVFQVVVQKALELWKTPAGAAQAAALVLWVVFFAPVTIVGLIEARRMGLGLSGQRDKVFDSLEARERARRDAAS